MKKYYVAIAVDAFVLSFCASQITIEPFSYSWFIASIGWAALLSVDIRDAFGQHLLNIKRLTHDQSSD